MSLALFSGFSKLSFFKDSAKFLIYKRFISLEQPRVNFKIQLIRNIQHKCSFQQAKEFSDKLKLLLNEPFDILLRLLQ